MSNYRHGKTGTRAHNTWLRMIDRCKNDRDGHYRKRGISVCDRWMDWESKPWVWALTFKKLEGNRD